MIVPAAPHLIEIMQAHSSATPPIVIGGVGGSGTRVVAQIVMDAGVCLGSDLNAQNDNLWFTLLFKRPVWFRTASPASIAQGFSLLEKAMTRSAPPTAAELAFLVRAVLDIGAHGHHPAERRSWKWALTRVLRMWTATPPAGAAGWGWKEPNALVYIEHLFAAWPAMKFIHVIRHGLDLAYSRNQQQARNWSHIFGVTPAAGPSVTPADSLEYWIRANERGVAAGRAAGAERFLLLNFDELCASSERSVSQLLQFIGAAVTPENFAALCRLPRTPKGTGRYRTRSLSDFAPEQLEAVRAFGFAVEE